MGDEAAYLVGALGDVPVHLAGAVDGVRGPALDPAAMDVAGLDETDADVAGNAAHRLPSPTTPADKGDVRPHEAGIDVKPVVRGKLHEPCS